MIVKEIWKDVEKYENYYEISNFGNLRSKDRYVKNGNGYRISKGKIIKVNLCKNGYLEYHLRKHNQRKVILAHRLVAEHFVPNPNNFSQINHLDENITNNKASNLQWCMPRENANYGNRNLKCRECNRRYFKRVCQYDLEGNLINEFESIGEASRKINGDISSIIRVCKNKQKTAYGYVWKYK